MFGQSMDADRFDVYAEYRIRAEDAECTALRMRLGGDDAERFEAEFRRSQEGRAAA